MRTLIAFASVVALGFGVAGCGGDEEPSDASSSKPTTASTSAGEDTSESAAGEESEASGDCASTTQAAEFSINGQLVAQFATLPTSSWSDTLGKLGELEDEVEALSTLQGDEVQKALAIYAQIPPIIEAGLGGDESATDQLAALIGTDVAESLKIKNTIVLAYGEQCQGAG